MSTYQTPRCKRYESLSPAGRFRSGKLAPVCAAPVRPSEGGILSQTAVLELDPIAGRLLTGITGEIYAVFVPVQAIDAIKDPAAAYAGMTEVIREKLLTGNPLFGLETEGVISKLCGIEPRSIGGVKKVNEAVRLAHNAAVNFLRQRKYWKATLLPHTNAAVTPALLSSTVLERFNAALDPDDRINGQVQLDIAPMRIPVSGIGIGGGYAGTPGTFNSKETNKTAPTSYLKATGANISSAVMVKMKDTTTNNVDAYADIWAEFAGAEAGNVALGDFYNAETMDRLTRYMAKMIEDDPQYGQENVLRWAHGLSLDTGKVPFLIHQETRRFGQTIVPAMDSAGVAGDIKRSDLMMQFSFSVPVPRTELGGIVITFLSVKPEETLATQPHPILSDVWGLDNFVADELALDPVPVTFRELDSGVAAGQEATVAFYTGLNAMKQNYTWWGFNRHVDPNTVASKSSVWQLQVPLSVTPDSVIYPDTISQYPFADQNAEVCLYNVASSLVVASPMIVGPSPVETLPIINTEDIFEVIP